MRYLPFFLFILVFNLVGCGSAKQGSICSNPIQAISPVKMVMDNGFILEVPDHPNPGKFNQRARLTNLTGSDYIKIVVHYKTTGTGLQVKSKANIINFTTGKTTFSIVELNANGKTIYQLRRKGRRFFVVLKKEMVADAFLAANAIAAYATQHHVIDTNANSVLKHAVVLSQFSLDS